MNDPAQLGFFPPPEIRNRIREVITEIVGQYTQPSANELLQRIETELGWAARWELRPALEEMQIDKSLQRVVRDYAWGLVASGDIENALRGDDVPDREAVTTGIDSLLRSSKAYRESKAFSEMITFMGRFREYSPYNNMLVRVQNPACSFYAREKDWWDRFERRLKEDARPMLILAPMHPVMLVYDLDQTDGPPLPEELTKFASFEGEFDAQWLDRMIKNAAGYRICVDFKALSSTNAGFATSARGSGDWKMRVAIHDGLDAPSRLGVLCHELAHILLGHLGTDRDLWWPSRNNLTHGTVEIEAESVAYIVASRLGLKGSSAAYVSHHATDGALPPSVSLDLIAKVSGIVERMAREVLPLKQTRRERERRRSQ